MNKRDKLTLAFLIIAWVFVFITWVGSFAEKNNLMLLSAVLASIFFGLSLYINKR